MNISSKHYWTQLKNAPYWPLLGIFWLITRLPLSTQIKMGRQLGGFIGNRVKKVRHITAANINYCFSERPKEQRQALIDKSLEELGVLLFETINAWFRNRNRLLKNHFQIENAEYLDQAIDTDKGIILLSSHYGSPDLNISLMDFIIKKRRPYNISYRRPSNATAADLIVWLRSSFCDDLIAASDMRGITRALKKGHIVWFAPDLEPDKKNTAFVDFFGKPAATNIVLNRLAKLCNAVVLPYTHYRVSDKGEYRIRFLPPLNEIPSDDPIADARLMNQTFEQIISPHPERYMWSIKRFRYRPEGEPPIY